MERKKIVPDTSIIIDRKLSEMIENGELDNVEIIIPEMVLDELQAQANRGLEIGFEGLEEIKKIRALSEGKNISVTHTGRRPTMEEIQLARKGRIDSLIRDVAKELNATLYTEDMVQAEVALAEGLDVVYIKVEEEPIELIFEKYFDEKTMSVHLKEGAVPLAKRGSPGKFKLVKLSDEPLQKEEIIEMAENIVNATRHRDDAHFEISKTGAEVIQLGTYRIAIAKPPFSKGHEITIVRPIVKLSLEDYKVSDKLMKRLKEKAEGILIAGPPGSGKSTFAQSLAEFYSKQGKIVKTMESPRDLQVPPEITQYGPLNGSMSNTSDVLLLVRPDYTIYDEIRKTHDFHIFSDMRLAGVGMVGVVHATDPVDAIQRFIGKTELGMIPHILDTIIYIKDGRIEKVYSVTMKVRVPTGMVEQDLARPIVEIREFHTNKLEYEIYTYGEENIVIKVEEKKEDSVQKLAKERIREELVRFDRNVEVEFLSGDRVLVRVDNSVIPKIIGKNGKKIERIEKKLGISIDVEPKVEDLGKPVSFEVSDTGGYMVLSFKKSLKGKTANVYISGEYLFTATIGKNGQIKVSKDSDIGKELLRATTKKKPIEVFI